MDGEWTSSKDIFVLLSIIHLSKIDVSVELCNKIVSHWPAQLGNAPTDGEGLVRRVNAIWTKSVSGGEPRTPELNSVVKGSNGTCPSSAIVVLDSDEEVDHDTPISARPLPNKFKVPPAAGVVTLRSVSKTPAFAKPSKFAIDFDESEVMGGNKTKDDDEIHTFTIRCTPPVTETTAAKLVSPKSMHIRSMTAKLITPPKNNKRPLPLSHRKPDEDNVVFAPPTIASTRKRRRGLKYDHVPEDHCFDNPADDDYEFEEDKGDDGLNERFDAACPFITPSKPQKKR